MKYLKYISRLLPDKARIWILQVYWRCGGSLGVASDEAIKLAIDCSKMLSSSGPYDLVVHIGAHRGQEARKYEQLGAKTVVWIEADPDHISHLRKHLSRRTNVNHLIFEAIASDADDQIQTLYRYDNHGASNSVYPPGSDMNKQFPNLKMTGSRLDIKTVTLPTILKKLKVNPDNFLNSVLIIDVQGHEYSVLLGCSAEFIKKFNTIVCEVSEASIYHGATKASVVLLKLEELGFNPITEIPRFHGDVVFVQK